VDLLFVAALGFLIAGLTGLAAAIVLYMIGAFIVVLCS
jgi:hypothetical protein